MNEPVMNFIDSNGIGILVLSKPVDKAPNMGQGPNMGQRNAEI